MVETEKLRDSAHAELSAIEMEKEAVKENAKDRKKVKKKEKRREQLLQKELEAAFDPVKEF